MRKFLSILMIALISSFAITSCGGGDAADSSDGGDTATETASYNSEYFSDVVTTNSGEFAGLELGDSRSTVKSKLSSDAFDDETDSYLYYYWDLGNNQYYLDLYFDENDKLNSIDGYVYFYDADNNYDKAAAADFYKDMKANFVDKYGSEEEYSDEDFTYISWYFDDKDAEVGMDNGEVYWYIYSYEDDMDM